AYRRSLSYVVVSRGQNRWAADSFRQHGWRIGSLGGYWLLAVAPRAGAGDCTAQAGSAPSSRSTSSPLFLWTVPVVARAVRQAEVLEDLDGVVVAMPDREAGHAEAGRGFLGRLVRRREPERRDAAVHRRRAVQRPAVGKAVEEPLAELPLVLVDELPAD